MNDGWIIFWNKGGEVCYFIDWFVGWYVIMLFDCMSWEGYEFVVVLMFVIEKYFYGYFGGFV